MAALAESEARPGVEVTSRILAVRGIKVGVAGVGLVVAVALVQGTGRVEVQRQNRVHVARGGVEEWRHHFLRTAVEGVGEGHVAEDVSGLRLGSGLEQRCQHGTRADFSRPVKRRRFRGIRSTEPSSGLQQTMDEVHIDLQPWQEKYQRQGQYRGGIAKQLLRTNEA